MLVTVCRKFKFDSAHFLPDYIGRCHNLHGHTWSVEIAFEGPINENGMVVDFNEIKKIVEEEIINQLDHTLLNDTLRNPTAENLTCFIFNKLNRKWKLNYGSHVKFVRVWETENSYAEYQA